MVPGATDACLRFTGFVFGVHPAHWRDQPFAPAARLYARVCNKIDRLLGNSV
jgi:hypothetical protein